MGKAILAIDQGTTSSRALVFDIDGNQLGLGQHELTQHFPNNGWVEHDADEIWSTTLASCQAAMIAANVQTADILCIGITNQRETTVIWDRSTGKPIHMAIVWQDRRTSDYCAELKRQQDTISDIQDKTGLLLDPYFSATKIRWILDNVPDARARANRGELAFGTIDSWLLWKLTGGKATSPTPPTHLGPCFLIFDRSAGMKTCLRCSKCPNRCCRRLRTVLRRSALQSPLTSVRQSPSPG